MPLRCLSRVGRCPSVVRLKRFFPGHNFSWTNRRVLSRYSLNLFLDQRQPSPLSLTHSSDLCQICATNRVRLLLSTENRKSSPRPAHVPTSSLSISNCPPDQPLLLKALPLPRPERRFSTSPAEVVRNAIAAIRIRCALVWAHIQARP